MPIKRYRPYLKIGSRRSSSLETPISGPWPKKGRRPSVQMLMFSIFIHPFLLKIAMFAPASKKGGGVFHVMLRSIYFWGT